MPDTIQLAELSITVTRKNVRNVHLSVHPPSGRVKLVAPAGTRLEVVRAYAISKIGWIRQRQADFRAQVRETPRQYVERESHYLWGRRYLLSIVERELKPSISVDHRRITLIVRPGSTQEKRQQILHEWHKSLLHAVVPDLIRKWEPKLEVNVARYHLQRMKTRWGGCNHRAGSIRINTELVKKPRDLLEYIVVHEMLHLIVPTHSEKFRALLDLHYPTWQSARSELNELPLAAEAWRQPRRRRSRFV
jgi:predicted metal-dependent hydrolase